MRVMRNGTRRVTKPTTIDVLYASGHEEPMRMRGLKAWFDSRTDDYFTFSTGAQISSWRSRAGSLGSVTWEQAVSANQPTRALSVSGFAGKNAVRFDGSNDFFVSSLTNEWSFMHNGTGGDVFAVLVCDSSGGAIQTLLGNMDQNTAHFGFLARLRGAGHRIGNGSGVGYINAYDTLATRLDVPQWMTFGYADELFTQSLSGVTTTNPDTGGQEPAQNNPTRALALGAATTGGSQAIKGHVAQLLFFDHVLSTAERMLLADWAARLYGWQTLVGTTNYDAAGTRYFQSESGLGNTAGDYWVAALVKYDSQPAGTRYALRSVTASAGFLLGTVSSAGTLRFGCYWDNVGVPAFANSPVHNMLNSDYGKLKLLVGVKGGGFLKFYLDGVQVGTSTAFAGYILPSDTTRVGSAFDCGAIFGAAGGNAEPTALQVSAYAAAVKAAGRMVAMPSVQTDRVWNCVSNVTSTDEVSAGDMAATGALLQSKNQLPWGW